MKDKIISGIIGAVIGGIIVFGYSSIFNVGQNNNLGANSMGPGSNGGVGMDIDSSNISDEQLEKMAERSGVSVEELKEKIEAGEDIRPNRGGNRNVGESNTGKILEEESENLE